MAQRFSKWRQVIDNEVVPLLERFKEKGIKPSLRTIHYSLISRPELGLPNTRTTYGKLSEYIVEARKEGRIAWDALSDKTRYTMGDFYDYYVSPEKYIELAIRYLKHTPDNYEDSIYKWYNQPHYVEVWIEKDALSGTFESFLKDIHVKIVINKGFASWTSLHENCKRLSKVIENDPSKHIHILYFGDYDPSGVDMDRHMHEAFSFFCLEGPDCFNREIDFQRIAVTRQQIEQFGLPPKPEDTDTLAKLDNDTRTKKFIEKNNGELYAVELDALLAIVPDEFEQLVKDSVYQYWDESIYEQVLEKPQHSKESLRRLVSDKVSEAGF